MIKHRRLIHLNAALVLLSACGKKDARHPHNQQARADAQLASALVASEELILKLTPRLKALDSELFAPGCIYAGLAPQPDAESVYENLGVTERLWQSPLDGRSIDELAIADLVAPLGNPTPAFDHGNFAIISAQFADGDRSTFATEVGFSGAKLGLSVSSQQRVVWSRSDAAWKITGWHVRSLKALSAAKPVFEEALDAALPDPAELAAARTSLHHKILVEGYFGGKAPKLPKGYSDSRFFPDSVNVHPAVSAADIDGDGFDDLYVCVRWGRNMLFRNRGDGTFEECAARFGLDIDGRNTVALFADFDNDADLDLLLGRSLERSMLLMNEAGRFTPHPDPVAGGELPWLVTSASCADFNNDGLLDVYLCTYSPLDINTRITGDTSKTLPAWAGRFLSPEHAAEVGRRHADAHSYLGQVGPPNVLLVNRGTRFEIAAESQSLAGYRNSFQAAWCDYDGDGDPDLYVANDFSHDHFYRNDGDAGFIDITLAAGIDTMGFAMGAAWGDYDGDGSDDLYVSNMYSKAGRRITAQVPKLDQRFSAAAAGNFLYRNSGDGKLERMSGADDKPVPVHLAGWSWGGQFCDFDNDGHLDLYVSSGFYTPPAGEDKGVDL